MPVAAMGVKGSMSGSVKEYVRNYVFSPALSIASPTLTAWVIRVQGEPAPGG